MWDLLVAPFLDFAFMRRALVGCLAMALGATPVGVFLMLRRMSLTVEFTQKSAGSYLLCYRGTM
jgi:ABC-type Mn2+/Zn2+ transport system permease subunit